MTPCRYWPGFPCQRREVSMYDYNPTCGTHINGACRELARLA